MKHLAKIQSEFIKSALTKADINLSVVATSQNQLMFFTKEQSKHFNDFIGEKNELNVRHNANNSIIYVGCGNENQITQHVIRSATSFGIQKAQHLNWQKISVIIPPWFNNTYKYACIEGTLLGSYIFDEYRSIKKPKILIEIVDKDFSTEQLEEIKIICNCTNYARDLTNRNASDKYPEKYAEEISNLFSKYNVTINILTEKEIVEKGLGLLNAVSSGSPKPPRLIILQYKGNPTSKENIAIIGKGIIFDTGGLDLKEENMKYMRRDMAGSAVVAALMKAICELKMQINITGVMPLSYNSVDAKSYLPGDIYKSYDGKTVQIDNTDAEGRLVLADAIAYCKKNYNPTMIIDVATLTKAVSTALGKIAAGLFSNDDDLAKNLIEAGLRTNEKLWRLPLYKEYEESIRSDLADLKNSDEYEQAKSAMGAAFLKQFVGQTPWAHLDIAGVAYIERLGDAPEHLSHGEDPHYATGFGVRLLWQYLKNKIRITK